MTKQDMEIKMNGWTFEETVKTAENLMESEKNMFKWDVLRHLRDFAELFFEELRQYREIGTPEECRAAVEKQEAKKPKEYEDKFYGCPVCGNVLLHKWEKYPTKLMNKKNGLPYCLGCGQRILWEV